MFHIPCSSSPGILSDLHARDFLSSRYLCSDKVSSIVIGVDCWYVLCTCTYNPYSFLCLVTYRSICKSILSWFEDSWVCNRLPGSFKNTWYSVLSFRSCRSLVFSSCPYNLSWPYWFPGLLIWLSSSIFGPFFHSRMDSSSHSSWVLVDLSCFFTKVWP